MIDKQKKYEVKQRRVSRQRFKLKNNGSSPRLVFNKSNKYLTAQIIDDTQGKTLAYATTLEKTFPKVEGSKKSIKAAKELGKIIAERSIKAGIKQVMLDRSGMIYHGRLSEFAQSAREKGLQF
jgi:large subunit ribosomal protein L18